RIFFTVLPPNWKVGGGMEEPDRGTDGVGWKYLIKGELWVDNILERVVNDKDLSSILARKCWIGTDR
ncbi:MAG: hypothetical protein ACOYLU_13575, partial [Limisphaerales bacterium]